MNNNLTVRVVKQVEVTDLEGEKVMIDFESGNYFLVKGTGNDIWDMIMAYQNITVGNIIEGLMNEYEVDLDTCSNSVYQFLGKLVEFKFIELV